MSMMTILLLELIVFFLLLLCSAFFSSAEMALFSLSRAKVLSYRKDPSKVRRRIYFLMDDYHRTLITIILGNMFVNSCISMLNEEMLAKLALGPLETTLLSAFTGIVVLLLFGEITPMTIAYVHCDAWASKVATPIYFFRKALHPVTRVVGFVCDRILDLLGRKPGEVLTDEEYLSYLDSCAERGAFTGEEVRLLKETFSLRGKTVDEIMRSRVDLVHVNYSTPPEGVLEAIRRGRQAYMPVGDEDLDTVDALFSSVDFFNLPSAERTRWRESGILRKAVFLPESCTLIKALHTLHEKKIPAALVADEYGGVSGMLTIQDIYSELAGKSVELTEQAEWQAIRLNADSWVFDGLAPLDFVRENSDWDDCNLDGEFDSSTLSGLFCEAFGALPQINDSIHIGEDVELKALAVSKNRVTKVLVHLEKTDGSEAFLPPAAESDRVSRAVSSGAEAGKEAVSGAIPGAASGERQKEGNL